MKYKDTNDWYDIDEDDYEGWYDTLADLSRGNLKKRIWNSYISNNHKLDARKTGFQFMDGESRLQNFKPGFYVVGANPSVGKTTWCYQLAEQLAEKGTPVLFVSCEMPTELLLLKSFARKSQIDNRQIDTGFTNDILQKISAELDNKNVPLFIYCPKTRQAKKIWDMVQKFHEKFVDQHPVVIVDYLQYIQVAWKYNTDKQRIDEIIRQMKYLQVQMNLTWITISQFNRASYGSSVSLESFKETGDIEYTADVIWGLQYSVYNGRGTGNPSKTVSPLERDAAIKADPRKITLRCIKNRFGPLYSVDFDYYPQFDLFMERPTRSSISFSC